jgi:hypothetical protein
VVFSRHCATVSRWHQSLLRAWNPFPASGLVNFLPECFKMTADKPLPELFKAHLERLLCLLRMITFYSEVFLNGGDFTNNGNLVKSKIYPSKSV